MPFPMVHPTRFYSFDYHGHSRTFVNYIREADLIAHARRHGILLHSFMAAAIDNSEMNAVQLVPIDDLLRTTDTTPFRKVFLDSFRELVAEQPRILP